MQPHSRRRQAARLALAATLAFGLFGNSSAQAAFSWDGGDGTSQLWSTGTNWNPDGAPANGFSDTFTFGGTTNVGTNLVPLNNDLTGGTATAITFNLGAGAFVLGGNAITLGGNIANNETTNIQTMKMNMELGAADRTITIAAGGRLVLGGALSRSAGSDTAVISAGGGTLALTGTWNDTDVGIRVGGGGTMELTGATITGRRLAIGSGAITVGAGSSLNFSNQNSSFGVNNAAESSSYSQTGGTVTLAMLTIANGQGTDTTMNISAGTLNVSTLRTSRGPTTTAANDSTTTASAINVTGTGLLNATNFTFGDGATGYYGKNTVTVGTGAGSTAEFRATTSFNWGNNVGNIRNNTVEVDGGLFSTMATTVSNPASNAVMNIGNGGRLQARNASTTFLNGLDTFNIKNGGAIIDTQTNDITITPNILNFSGATTASLTKSGAGILTLSGANTYGGGTLIGGGTVALTGSGTLGATTGALTFSGTGTALNLGSTTQTVASVAAGNTATNISANITGGGGTLNASGTLVSQGLSGNGGAYGGNPTLGINTGMVVNGSTLIGRSNLEISGGTYSTSRFTSNAAGSADWGRLAISGGSVTATNGVDGTYGTTGSNGTTATFQLELNGGTLSTPLIKVANRDLNAAGPGGNNDAHLIWNGGVVKATGVDNANFVQVYGDGGNTGPKQATYVSSGGAKIDTNGLNIGIQVKLLANPSSAGGGLTKDGLGTLTLSGANNYTGGTTVAAGVLAIATSAALSTSSVISVSGGELNFNSSAAAGNVTLTAGNATLSGAGAGRLGDVAYTAASGTTYLKPGNSIGTLLVNDLALNATTTSVFEIARIGAALSSDLVSGSGADILAFAGALQVVYDVTHTTALTLGDTFTLFSGFNFGAATGTFASIDLSAAALDPGLAWDTSNLYTSGSITVVPEPTATAFGLLALGGLALRRRRD